jgi:hypothetical protein
MTPKENNLRRPRRGVRPHVHTLAATNPREIDVHIEELVLHGFTPLDGRHVTDTLAAELRRLLTERGVPARWQNNPEKLESEPTPSRLTNPTNAGDHIASAIYGSNLPKPAGTYSSKSVSRIK